MKKPVKPAQGIANPTTDEIPPGATKAAADRPIHRGGGAPGSGAGPRHATNDPDSPDESYEAVDSNDPLAEAPLDEEETLVDGPPYSGRSGGAVGGSPAELRSSGGHLDHPIYVESSHRGDSTIGSRPQRLPTPKPRRGKGH